MRLSITGWNTDAIAAQWRGLRRLVDSHTVVIPSPEMYRSPVGGLALLVISEIPALVNFLPVP